MQRQFHLFAELERRRKAREVFEHQRQNALQGFVNGGMPPYGYRRKEVEVVDDADVKKKKLTWDINPDEVPAGLTSSHRGRCVAVGGVTR